MEEVFNMATYYVSPTGNDSTGNGTSGNPWQTISKGVTSSITGDTVILMDGTYTMSADITMANPITLQAQNTGLAVLDFAGANKLLKLGSNTAFTYYLTGLKFTNSVANISSLGSVAINAQQNNGSNEPTLYYTNCIFTGITALGAYDGQYGLLNTYYNTPRYHFINCLFYNNTISPQANEVLLGFELVSDGYIPQIIGCTFYLNTVNPLRGGLIGPGNTTWLGNPIIKNCIIYNATGSTCKVVASGSVTLSYSDTYNMSSVPAGTGNITGDPLFVDAANGNFNLRPTSPCIDKGTLI